MDLRQLSIKKIGKLLSEANSQEINDLLRQAEEDGRIGVKKLVQCHRRRLNRIEELLYHAREMLKYEQELFLKGYKLVAGVDEVGRGCLAGPLVAAAVILPTDFLLLGLKDSKQLASAERTKLATIIKKKALAWKIVAIENEWIDRFGLHRANLMALTEVTMRLDPQPDFVLSDGFNLPLCSIPQLKLPKGDSISHSIAAASVIAKVHRDALMIEASKGFKPYGFDKNKGYGTKEHLAALRKYGPCRLHRRSFAPVKSWREEQLAVEFKGPDDQHKGIDHI